MNDSLDNHVAKGQFSQYSTFANNYPRMDLLISIMDKTMATKAHLHSFKVVLTLTVVTMIVAQLTPLVIGLVSHEPILPLTEHLDDPEDRNESRDLDQDEKNKLFEDFLLVYKFQNIYGLQASYNARNQYALLSNGIGGRVQTPPPEKYLG